MADLDLIDDDDILDTPGESFFDPYAQETAWGIDRDRWDRPLIGPDPRWSARAVARGSRSLTAKLADSNGWPDGKVERWQLADGRRPFARVSNLAKGIDPMHGLGIWKLRHIALAVARRPDLQELLCTMTYQDGKAIDAVCEEAMIRAKDDGTDPEGKLKAAHRGTRSTGRPRRRSTRPSARGCRTTPSPRASWRRSSSLLILRSSTRSASW